MGYGVLLQHTCVKNGLFSMAWIFIHVCYHWQKWQVSFAAQFICKWTHFVFVMFHGQSSARQKISSVESSTRYTSIDWWFETHHKLWSISRWMNYLSPKNRGCLYYSTFCSCVLSLVTWVVPVDWNGLLLSSGCRLTQSNGKFISGVIKIIWYDLSNILIMCGLIFRYSCYVVIG